MRVRSLFPHADYRCGQTGACCSAGWEIPIEREQHAALADAVSAGVLVPPRRGSADSSPLFETSPDLPPEMAAIFAREPDGRCVFLEEAAQATCAVHRLCGERALPMACHQFPRVAILRPGGIDVTLSHWCPTALRGLLRRDRDLTVATSPAAHPAERRWEGLDARRAHPPLLRPDCLMGWEEHDAWEALMVQRLADIDDPFDALGALLESGERLRKWSPSGNGSLLNAIEAEEARTWESRRHWRPPVETLIRLHDLVRDTLPSALQAEHSSAAIEWPLEGWTRHRWIATRHLAARAFANWTAIQGEGVRTTLLHLACTLAVLAAKASRRARESGGTLDESQMQAAVRDADLMLIHHADAGDVTRALGFIESETDVWNALS